MGEEVDVEVDVEADEEAIWDEEDVVRVDVGRPWETDTHWLERSWEVISQVEALDWMPSLEAGRWGAGN